MAFSWDDLDVTVNPALVRLPEYTSGVGTLSFANGGHIQHFPEALDDTATVANAFPSFADLMASYANAASASTTAAALQAAALTAHSSTSLSILTGTKTFNIESGKQFAAGDIVLLTSDANPTTFWMVLSVTSYSGVTMIGDVLSMAGSGSRSDWTIRHTGQPGRAMGFMYLWNTSTAISDPGSGSLKINNASPPSANALHISETTRAGVDMAANFAAWGAGTSTIKGRIVVADVGTPANMFTADITSIATDNGAWDTFTIANGSGVLPANGAIVAVFFIPKGDKGDTGTAGSVGATGATGADGGFKFAFNTATAGDPGSGKFRFNNVTFGSATVVAFSETDGNSNALANFLLAIDDSTSTNKYLGLIIKQGGAGFFSFFATAALVDQGTYDTYNITPIASSGSIANNDNCSVVFIPIGDKGDTGSTGANGAAGSPGPTTAPTWVFDTATAAADPGANKFRLDNATIGSVTNLYIDDLGPGGGTVSGYVDSWDDSTNTTHRGSLFIVEADDPTKWAIFTTGVVVNSTGYRTVPLTFVNGTSVFTNAATCAFFFSRTGNTGAGAGTYLPEGVPVTGHLAQFGTSAGAQLADGGVHGALANLNTVGTAQIDAAAVTNSVLANMAADTVKMRRTGTGTGSPTDTTLANLKTDMAFVKADVGLSNVDNTSDANKPISTADRAALDVRSICRVRAATGTNVTIATALNNGDVIDTSITLVTGDLVLVNSQVSTAENGIYVVGPSPARHTEFDAFADYPGLLVLVEEGTVGVDSMWLCTSDVGGTIDVTGLSFLRWAGPSSADGRSILSAADFSAMRTLLSLVPGTNVQAQNVNLAQLAALSLIADRLPYANGTNTLALTTFTAAGRAIIDDATASDQLTTLGLSTFIKTLVDDADAPTALATLGAVGKQAIPIPAKSMESAVTNGAADGAATLTNQKFVTKDFDTTTQEATYFSFRMPKSWNESTVTFQLVWSHAATSVNFGVVFELAAVAVGDNEAGDAAFGTAQTTTDTGGTTNNLYISPESAAITIAGTIAAGDYVWFRLRRVPANGSDTLAVDARVHELTLFITTDTGNDA